MFVEIPTDTSDEKWIKAGVALFTSLKFDWLIINTSTKLIKLEYIEIKI